MRMRFADLLLRLPGDQLLEYRFHGHPHALEDELAGENGWGRCHFRMLHVRLPVSVSGVYRNRQLGWGLVAFS